MTLSSRAKRPMRSFLAAALAIATAPAFAGGPYSQTYFFGDSLTDAGYYRPLLPASVRPVTGQFTTNPGFVWSQWLADYYGTSAAPNGNGQTGTNYAAGGARVGVNTTGALGPQPSLTTQMNNYLTANGGRADSRALYTVWGGANDLFAITNAGAPAATTIAAAVASEVGMVTTLRNAGAQYILVSNIPDLGITPAFRALGAAAQANGTALTTTYNNSLFSTLASNGLRVIPLDTFNLLREIAANPTAYGFTNITGTACQPQITANSLTCNPTSYVTPNAADTYLFADGVHPTSRAHQILSHYAVSVLEGPRQIAALPHSTAVIGRARADRVANHLGGKPDGDGTRWWVDTRADVQTYDSGNLYDSVGPSLTGGVDWTRGNFVFGAFGGLGRNFYDFGNSAGDFEQLDGTLGGFAAWYGEKLWVNGQLSYSQIRYDVDREIWLGPVKRSHEGSPDGKNLSFGVNAGLNLGEGKVKHGPVIGLLAQRIDVDGYSENNATQSTALAYPDQNFDSLIGTIGWQATIELSDHMTPYAKVTYDREFEDYAEQAFARSLTVTGSLPYAVPALEFDDSYATAVLGARTELFGLDANIGLSTTIGQTDGTDATVFATFGKSF
jgi:outer membrane lipase/esterase